MASEPHARVIGRYVLHDELAAGGSATVHLGRMRGPIGFSRIVAIKRLHPHLASDPELSAMLLDEARLVTRIRHPNVVSVLDVVAHEKELLLVLDYVHGEALSRLFRACRKRGERVEPSIAAALVVSVLHGLHAAHGATDEAGTPLRIVHRDVSPQNVLVGVDGVARILDFGIAKATSRVQVTREGEVKGKFAYMAPEQLAPHVRGGREAKAVDHRVDVYAVGIVLWELLTGRRMFEADDEGVLIAKVLDPRIEPASTFVREASVLDSVLARALAIDPDARYADARAMAIAIEEAVPLATTTRIGAWVESLAGDAIAERAALVTRAERATDVVEEETVTTTPPAPARRAPNGVLVAIVVVALMISGALVARWAFTQPTASPAQPAASSPTVTSAPLAAPSPAPTPLPSPSVATTASAPSSKPKAVLVAAPKPSAHPSASPPASATGKPPSCDPPYVIDATGKTIFKVECL